ncbi:polyphosphate kinase 1, partial [Selenomonadales bacterium OttesenSCG-928-I06]|nr:polyphosphate kinase 1 [Selenomonadales bacterium OttesenSCG-928-I06]
TEIKEFIFIDDIIKNYCSHLFTGYTIKDIVPFRITRDADLEIAEEEAKDLLAEVEKSLRQRNRGNAVRLEIGKTPNKNVRQFLIDTLKLETEDVYEINSTLDLTCFFKFIDSLNMKNLQYEPFTPQVPQDLFDSEKRSSLDTLDIIDMFEEISKKDILMHHPYESFEPALNFIKQAAVDKDVLAIKQTLYRISGNSPLVRELAKAAENSKQVTVLLELKARFDEENNILWAKRLEDAGCHVIYGLIGLKTHAKMALVVRREHNGIKRYVHMSTGNYNDKTAKGYTDLALFTANEQLTNDISNFFNVLSGYSDPPIWNKIAVSPIGLREKVKDLIDEEIELAKQGQGGHIILKMNSLLDKDMILKLYEASCNGVKIELLVRGICSLRPGVKDVSENITVRSIVGRYLEHHRIFYFANGGDEKIFLSSADLMPRNLNDRVELLFPLEDMPHIKRVKEMLQIMLKDTSNSYIMDETGNYKRVPKKKDGLNSQAFFCKQAKSLIHSQEINQNKRFEAIRKIETL